MACRLASFNVRRRVLPDLVLGMTPGEAMKPARVAIGPMLCLILSFKSLRRLAGGSAIPMKAKGTWPFNGMSGHGLLYCACAQAMSSDQSTCQSTLELLTVVIDHSSVTCIDPFPIESLQVALIESLFIVPKGRETCRGKRDV
ncbi:hypothetical protein KC330_g163 [Hortaea werneckii]|nr:hypothetical protein KC330_g163 [Hortaea werneckii]